MSANVISLRDYAEPNESGLEHTDAKQDSLDQRAVLLSMRHKDGDALEILRAAILDEFPDRIALVSSFGAESSVLLKLVSEIKPDIPVIFLDTQKHFAQTLNHRKKLAHHLGLTNVLDIQPNREELNREDHDGNLWRHDPDACCTLRKVRPLAETLKNYDAWITGRKQFHGGERMALPIFDAASPHIKVNPLVKWKPEDIDAYLEKYQLPAHPLVAQGYPSIGCWPCTHPVAKGGDVRDGRWRGAAKTECGIHVSDR